MTSFPATMPTSPGIRRANWGLRFNTKLHRSRFSGSTQAVRNQGGEAWMVEAQLPPMISSNKQIWMAFLNSLAGTYGYFRMGDPAYTGARGTAGGTPLVNGASQTGNSLITDGWSAGATFLKGDYFQLGDYLYQANTDTTADGSGNMTIVFEPGLRASPANNDALTISSPKTIMRLTDDGFAVDEDPDGLFHISFAAVEALLGA